MSKWINWLYGIAVGLGGPGLFGIAFLDSSFISLPQINDLLVVLMVTKNKAWMPYYALMATLGSIAGCLALYFVGRKGGDALVQKRFKGGTLERASNLMRKYGAMALIVPALLPPPAPFKIFVLLGGVANIPLKTFILAIGFGRGVRYFGEGILAVMYGKQALDYIHQNSRTVGAVLGLVALAGGVAYYLWRRRTSSRPESVPYDKGASTQGR